MASFGAVSFPVSFDGMAARTGISPSDSEELWLLWEVDPSASLISQLPRHRCWSLYCWNSHQLGVHLQELHHQSQLCFCHRSHRHHGMWTSCIHSLCCWILLVILAQLLGNRCWMLGGRRTLLGWSHEVESWSRIWLARMWVNVKPLSLWVKLLHWGWLCQRQHHH